METDLAVLSRRVSRLERVIGTPSSSSCTSTSLSSELKAQHALLDSVVPEVFISATRQLSSARIALGALFRSNLNFNANTSSLSSIPSRANAAAKAACELDSLSEVALNKEALQLKQHSEKVLQTTIMAARARSVQQRECIAVDRLLAEYNSAIALLNARLLRVAAAVRALEQSKASGSDIVEEEDVNDEDEDEDPKEVEEESGNVPS